MNISDLRTSATFSCTSRSYLRYENTLSNKVLYTLRFATLYDIFDNFGVLEVKITLVWLKQIFPVTFFSSILDLISSGADDDTQVVPGV